MLPVVCCATAGVAASQSEERMIIEEIIILFMPDCLRTLRNSVKWVPIRRAQRAPDPAEQQPHQLRWDE